MEIQEISEKIIRAGVEKAEAEAANIIAEAKAQAEKIVAEAKEQAAAIDAQSKKKNEELAVNTRNELKLYTSQALNALKSEITNVLCGSIIKTNVDALVNDKEFLSKFTVALASKWAENEPIVIGSAEAESLKAYFAANAKALLDKGVKIEKINGKDVLFTVSPADGSYKVNFGQEEFESYFQNFLRPQLIEMLF